MPGLNFGLRAGRRPCRWRWSEFEANAHTGSQTVAYHVDLEKHAHQARLRSQRPAHRTGCDQEGIISGVMPQLRS